MRAAAKTVIPKPGLILSAGMIFAAALFGAWGLEPSADPVSLPEMAPRPVMLDDGRALWVQAGEVSVAEWSACHAAGACTLDIKAPPGMSPEHTPATGLSFVDVGEYVAWINAETGHPFRLPSAGEWNIMARDVLPEEPDPIFTDPSLTWASAYLVEGIAPRVLKPRGAFSESPEGVLDLDGSVWEWTQECYSGTRVQLDPDRCPAFWVGGEHVAAMSFLVRDPARGGCAVGTPPAHLGMRLVSDRAI